MLLERLGRFCFSQLSPPIFFALALCPLLAASLFLFLETMQLQELKERFIIAARKEKLALERKERKERFLRRYSHTDPYFIDRQIESFPLLQNEKERIESLLNHPAFPESQPLKDRLFFLHENRFAFSEENIRTSSQMKEVEEKQRHPVQIDELGLKKILSLVEDVPIENFLPSNDSPQILIKDFRLKKQETSLQMSVFEVEMDLIKREFTKS